MKDSFTKEWIINSSVDICAQYEDGVLTLRGLHYQLVGLGMTNDIQHYKRVVGAMIDARWDNRIHFDQFSDLDRAMVGETAFKITNLDNEIKIGKQQIRAWMQNYHKNRWENQSVYPEVLIEKKALQGVFGPVCERWDVSLGACKALMEEQVVEWNLPPAPTKEYKIGKRKDGTMGYVGDTRDKNWQGLGQVELDAVKPEKLQTLCEEAIQSIFDDDLYADLMEQEGDEKIEYRESLRDYVNDLKD